MILLVDADNNPARNIQGINRLEPEDTVYIYYASKNKYFSNRERQADIINAAKCTVDFTKKAAANNAVDFAIAIDLRALIDNCPSEVIVLVSEDGHFKTIVERAKEATGCNNLFLASNIEDANQRYKLLDSNSLQDIHRNCVRAYGQEKGSELYKRMNNLFEQKFRLKEDSKSLASEENHLIKIFITNIIKAVVRTFRRDKDDICQT